LTLVGKKSLDFEILHDPQKAQNIPFLKKCPSGLKSFALPPSPLKHNKPLKNTVTLNHSKHN